MNIPKADQLLIIDVETVSQAKQYSDLSPDQQNLWQQKISWQLKDGDSCESFYGEKAAILAEFGKIICISAAYYNQNQNGEFELRVKSFYGKSEYIILQSFFAAISKLTSGKKNSLVLAGHNIREFDIPYICRRALINALPIHPQFMFQALKPWEVNVLDTMHLWRFGDHKHYTSLNLLAHCFNLPSPKSLMDGSKVGEAYWNKDALPEIAAYCEEDVITVASVLHAITSGTIPLPSRVVRTVPFVSD